jgi:hypothetical protein
MGEKFPTGSSPVFPPRDWTCVHCRKYHSKPHFAFPGQINYTKNLGELGRVKFNREGSGMNCDYYKLDTEIEKDKTGDSMTDEFHNAPLFCPYCGFEQTILYIIKIPEKWRSTKKK